MKTTQEALIVRNPSAQMMDFVIMVQKRKEEAKEQLRLRSERLYPKK